MISLNPFAAFRDTAAQIRGHREHARQSVPVFRAVAADPKSVKKVLREVIEGVPLTPAQFAQSERRRADREAGRPARDAAEVRVFITAQRAATEPEASA
jgi:hypothetical protein